MRKILLVPLLMLALALPGEGCSNVKDGDRQLFDQSFKASVVALKQVELVISMLSMNPGAALDAVSELQKVLIPLADIRDNQAQLIKNFKAPEKPVEYSTEASKAARQTSETQHKRGLLEWIYTIGGYLSVAAGVAATALNLPVLGPWLATTRIGQAAARILGGKIVKVGMDGLKTISTLRSEAEEKPLTPQRVVELAVKTFSPGTAAIADKVSDQIEAANKIEVTPIKELATTPS